MLYYSIKSNEIKNNIFIPKYYDPNLYEEINSLHVSHELLSLGELIDKGIISVQTGHEIGKMAYGTGNIPFVRTSDITNWEIKAVPKQGVSETIYDQYADKEDVQVGDILLVRDGTYLIGTNCMVTQLDLPMIYQSHILKLRVNEKNKLNPYLFFVCLNSGLVQRQIKNMQFTADIIDTLGSRFREVIVPIPKNIQFRKYITKKAQNALETRIKYKAAVKQMPLLIEKVIEEQDLSVFECFFSKSIGDILGELVQDTTTLEFGEFSAYTLNCKEIKSNIYLPKYYDPEIGRKLDELVACCDLFSIGALAENNEIEMASGDEIGKMAYGTGEIPFVRTSDFSNWEIKADTKQGVSEEIYAEYAEKEDVQEGDILIVRDGTYLVGTSCIITACDTKMLYCGGLIKIRVKNKAYLDEYLLLGLLNSYIVKRQIRTKQFTRDVIDTLGKRINEVIIPIPKDKTIRDEISRRVKEIVDSRVAAREKMVFLSEEVIKGSAN